MFDILTTKSIPVQDLCFTKLEPCPARNKNERSSHRLDCLSVLEMKCMLTKFTVNTVSYSHKRAVSYLIQDEYWEMPAGFVASLPSKYSATSAAFYHLSNRSMVWLSTEQCQAAECAGHKEAAAASFNTLRSCTLVTFYGSCPCCVQNCCYYHRDHLQKRKTVFILMPVEAKLSFYSSFIYHSML